MQLDDYTRRGLVQQWTFVDGQPRCTLDAIEPTDPDAAEALGRNAVVRQVVEAVEAYEAADPKPEDAPEAVKALALWRAGEPDPESEEWMAWDDARNTVMIGVNDVVPIPPILPVPNEISDRQFAEQLSIDGLIEEEEGLDWVSAGIVPAQLQAVVDAIPDPAVKRSANFLLRGATVFERSHPMTEFLGQSLGKTSAEIDDIWRNGSRL